MVAAGNISPNLQTKLQTRAHFAQVTHCNCSEYLITNLKKIVGTNLLQQLYNYCGFELETT